MEILHISAECYPVAKVGGLADVVGALPKYQVAAGEIAKVVIPAYRLPFFFDHHFETVHQGGIWIGNQWFHFNVLKESTNVLGFDLYLVDIPGLLDHGQVYGLYNDMERFLGFQVAVLDWVNEWKHLPDVLHCHDHHTGLIPFLAQYAYKYSHLKNIPSVLTIHNAQYQGQFGWDRIYMLPSFDLWKSGLLDWGGAINPLAAGIKCAWKVNTVSPGYMQELLEQANGLEELLRMESRKCSGILNGIDTEVWNPATDTYLYSHFSMKKDLVNGKAANKAELCEAYNLDQELPLFVFIGRLVNDKGADLLPGIIYKALQDHEGELNFMVLGSGDDSIAYHLDQLKHIYPRGYCFYKGYNEALSHQLYAGADFLLMPSRVEPCGLNQMYALRYGTMPLVRKTGGLKDTVIDIGDKGAGITFLHPSVWDVSYAIKRALEVYKDDKLFQNYRVKMMSIDHSWNQAAKEYINLYSSLKY